MVTGKVGEFRVTGIDDDRLGPHDRMAIAEMMSENAEDIINFRRALDGLPPLEP